MDVDDWSKLGRRLSPLVAGVLERNGFHKMAKVQQATIISMLDGHDVVVESPTGSGKTLAYIIPTIEILEKSKKAPNCLLAILVAPTRELSRQIHNVISLFTKESSYKTSLLVGKNTKDALEQIEANIIVGTPEIVAFFLSIKTSTSIKVLILDEADKMLDLGPRRCLNLIFARCNGKKRIGAFSATISEDAKVFSSWLKNPVLIQIKPKALSVPDTLSIKCLIKGEENKLSALFTFLTEHINKKIIVYFATCFCARYFHAILSKLGDFPNFLLMHGKMKEKSRIRSLDAFSTSKKAIMFSTDVMARGIDISDIDWVVQFDPPRDPDAFIHRCGRTARFGSEGSALFFLLPEERPFINYLGVKKIGVEIIEMQIVDEIEDRVLLMNLEDSDLMRQAVVAYVSFIRAYKENRAKFIFCFKKLGLGGLIRTFGLKHIPVLDEVGKKTRRTLERGRVQTRAGGG